MTSKACLAIGVADAPPLDYLRGAVNGAHAIADWAELQGYRTRLLTDEHTPVEFEQVATALTDLLGPGAERLLLYFAGHGLSTAAADDLWLLSRWSRVGQGASVNLLRNRLSRYGIRQLVLVSDACRTLVDASTRDITGNPVLDRGPFDESLLQMDLWPSASPARAAWMIPGPTPEETRCIFSGLLVEALTGGHADAFESGDPSGCISNFSLADFLENRVPGLASNYGVMLKPAIVTSIRPPDNIYVPTGPLTPPPLRPWLAPDGNPLANMGVLDEDGRVRPLPGESWTTTIHTFARPSGTTSMVQPDSRDVFHAPAAPPSPVSVSGAASASEPEESGVAGAGMTLENLASADARALDQAQEQERDSIRHSLDAFHAESRPDHFESGAGFVVAGGTIRRGVLGPQAVAVALGGSGFWRVANSDSDAGSAWWEPGSPMMRLPLPLLVELDNGDWVGAAAIPEFVLTFTLDARGAEAVIYRWIHDPRAPETEEVMARLRASGLAREQAPEVLAALRGHKHADPMLGVIAAYLHDAMGDTDNVRRTAYYFARRDQPIPFDIALLGRLEARREGPDGPIRVTIPPVPADSGARRGAAYLWSETPPAEGVLAGAFPFMRQGWGLLEPEGSGDLYPPGLSELTQHLRPSPFTTLDSSAGSWLAERLFEQE
ncbi:hypothetical protein [Halomonas alkalisoli]|uniref:hypothetical protein n=1 Tax=Halomonas alkalisoli TaxID=2907158 RepID=UPI001F178660|nr:hypothetical protein [Halomonas alkalisoli]MCE9683688.1 hypothetical protein [Halomonas alkalisoli]